MTAQKKGPKKQTRRLVGPKAHPSAHGPNGGLKRATDPQVDRRLPADLRAAAEALIAAPAPDHNLRRFSARREQIVQLKKYIMHNVKEKHASAVAVFETLRAKTKLNFSRRFISDYINLWMGEITLTGLERIAGELLRADYDADELREALKTYGAEDQIDHVAQILATRKRR